MKGNENKINYLRLSITDRCNLRCIYCVPQEGIRFVPYSEILTYEELLRVVRLSIQVGIRKVRLTGGEPLLRRGFIEFLCKLREIPELVDISLTTNGVLLKRFAKDIKRCGIERINISLDTLRPDRYKKITGRDHFRDVWEGIEEALEQGFDPVKINTVVMKGINNDELDDFISLIFKRPFHIRFIEFMPVGENNRWNPERFISGKEIFERVKEYGKLVEVPPDPYSGPARRFKIKDSIGEIGIIETMTGHQCKNCNRLRLTAEGGLRSCLFSDSEVDLRYMLRNGKSDQELVEVLRDTIEKKKRDIQKRIVFPRRCSRHMSSIGG